MVSAASYDSFRFMILIGATPSDETDVWYGIYLRDALFSCPASLAGARRAAATFNQQVVDRRRPLKVIYFTSADRFRMAVLIVVDPTDESDV